MSGISYYEYLSHDGIELFTVVCLPSEGGKFPTLIHREPYVEAEEKLSCEEVCEKRLAYFAPWINAGYAVVFQHCRGSGKSGGDFIPYVNERGDGLFLQGWVREQDFYNGEIFLCGMSYMASVHLVTAPYAEDIKGAVFEVQDSERYNLIYRNGFFKSGLHGGWYVKRYKQKSDLKRSFTADSYRMLPLADFTMSVLDEADEDFSEILRHPRKDDPFWSTHLGGAESRDAVKNAKIPILLVTGFYDIYTGGIFDMWKALGDERRASCALAVHPFGHSGRCNPEPIKFDGGDLRDSFPDYCVRWMDSIRGKCEPPFPRGKVTYYRLFDGVWACDDFYDASESLKFALGEDSVSYKYNPYAPASFKGGLSTNFGGCEWQDEPNSRYDIISLFTPELEEDVTVKGQISARLRVSSDCEDTCFYMRISLCKDEGYYGLRDDINQISNIDSKYMPGGWVDMSFSFDEHAFVMKKGERLRIDISSSAFPHYVPHTNNRGLYSEQKTARVATNTVDLASSHIEIPIVRFAEGGDDKKGI